MGQASHALVISLEKRGLFSYSVNKIDLTRILGMGSEADKENGSLSPG